MCNGAPFTVEKISPRAGLKLGTMQLIREAKDVRVTSSECAPIHLSPFYTGELCHYYILDETICPFKSVGSVLSFLSRYQTIVTLIRRHMM